VRFRGVCYDAGVVMGVNWRPHFDPNTARREMEIIRDELDCTAVRIGARDVGRLMTAAEAALDADLDVWLSPALWDRDADETQAYIERAAEVAERLRQRAPDRVMLVVGGELTLFMRGILPGKSLTARLGDPATREIIRSGRHNEPLNALLARAVTAVRAIYHGPLTHASLPFETVDWSRFDVVGVDHYRAARVKDRYVEMLAPLFATGKPVVVTEFGNPSCAGAENASALSIDSNVDLRRLFLHALPVIGRIVRPRVTTVVPRDEALQARELTDTLGVLDGSGVDGAFINTFIFEISPYDEDPRYDLDACSAGLVRPLTGGRPGTTFPDMR